MLLEPLEATPVHLIRGKVSSCHHRGLLVNQLLSCCSEAQQPAAAMVESFVFTDIMHHRPQLDLNLDYFVPVCRAETHCLQTLKQLISRFEQSDLRGILFPQECAELLMLSQRFALRALIALWRCKNCICGFNLMQRIHVIFEPAMCGKKSVFWNSNKEFCLCCVFIVGLITLSIRGRTIQHIWKSPQNLPPNYLPQHLVSLGDSRQVNSKQLGDT